MRIDQLSVSETQLTKQTIIKMEINILHISDLHFGISPKGNDEIEIPNIEEVCSSFISKMEDHEGQALNPKFIIVSGDISNTANAAEFAQASIFFNKLLKIFPSSQILFVPGNHDKERIKEIKELEKIELFNELKNICIPGAKLKMTKEASELNNVTVSISEAEKVLNSLFDDISKFTFISEAEKIKANYEKKRNELFNSKMNIDCYCNDNFKEYTEFVNPFYLKIESRFIPIKINGEILDNNLVKIVDYREHNLIFVLLNTAWLCQNSRRDPGKLTLGDPIIAEIKKELAPIMKDCLVITAMHHSPISFGRNDILDRGYHINNLAKISKFSNIILSGHEHGPHIKKPDFIYNEAQLINTGTFYTGKKEDYSCSFYQIDSDQKKVSIRNLKLNNTRDQEEEYNWIIEKIFIWPLTKPTELMEMNDKLIIKNDKTTTKLKINRWLYKKRKRAL